MKKEYPKPTFTSNSRRKWKKAADHITFNLGYLWAINPGEIARMTDDELLAVRPSRNMFLSELYAKALVELFEKEPEARNV